jgi:membrane-associated phospholipid phosphatase
VYLRAMRITLITLAANAALKRVVRRARPVMEDELPALVPTLSGRSYPSAHSSTSFAAAGALAGALPAPPLYAAAAAMALSRPYLGVHYPSDVVAGAVLGRALERLL